MPPTLRNCLFAVLCMVILSLPAPAYPQPADYAGMLQEKAGDLHLSGERTWHILLHYKKTFGGYRSRITDPNFFLDPDGKSDPERELQATIAAFFTPAAPDGEHPICRFPARLAWLTERLGIDRDRLPAPLCSQQQELIRMVEPRSAVLVFPVGHINSPASMFGHTLLRIDGSSKSNLISYAANYAADATDANGFLYAFKGLTGGYKGYYSLLPYYLKVKEYGDLEHRDIWEYRLDLSQEEVERMLLHTLELERISSDYYFLDENCSYNLLFLIEAGRPSLHLSDRTGVVVLPTNTIDIAREAGIVDEATYRPSQGARIVRIASELDDARQESAMRLAQGKIDPAAFGEAAGSEPERRGTLDLAAELVQLRLARKELDQASFSRLYLQILAQRSLLGQSAGDPYLVEPPPPPHAGHGTAKVRIGAGVRRDEWYGELGLLPAFHDLLDPDQGYLPGAQIKFLDTALSYSPAEERLWLKTLHLIDIVSLAPRNRIFKPYSWKVVAGWDTEAMADGEDSLIFRLNTGGGFSARSPFGGIAHALAEVDLNVGKRFRGKAAAGPGLSLGVLEQFASWWKLHLLGKAYYYPAGDDRHRLEVSLAQNFRLERNLSLGLDLSFGDVNGHGVREAALHLNRYF